MSYVSAAVRHLKSVDPVMRELIARVGPCRLVRECDPDEFGTLVDAIIYQQLAFRAAQTISRRFQALYANRNFPEGRLPNPRELLGTPSRKLRSVGLSRQKISYLRDLSRKTAAGQLALGKFGAMSDTEVIEDLIRVKGIGRWTAEMFLIFCLQRPDVLPVNDLGMQYGFRDAYGLRRLPSEKWMRATAEPWRPYRTIGTWYLWKLRRVNTNEER